MTRRAPFASAWSDHNRAERNAARRRIMLWASFWIGTALICLLWATAFVYAARAGLHGGYLP